MVNWDPKLGAPRSVTRPLDEESSFLQIVRTATPYPISDSPKDRVRFRHEERRVAKYAKQAPPKPKPSTMTAAPIDIILGIFQHLRPQDILPLSYTCKAFHNTYRTSSRSIHRNVEVTRYSALFPLYGSSSHRTPLQRANLNRLLSVIKMVQLARQFNVNLDAQNSDGFPNVWTDMLHWANTTAMPLRLHHLWVLECALNRTKRMQLIVARVMDRTVEVSFGAAMCFHSLNLGTVQIDESGTGVVLGRIVSVADFTANVLQLPSAVRAEIGDLLGKAVDRFVRELGVFGEDIADVVRELAIRHPPVDVHGMRDGLSRYAIGWALRFVLDDLRNGRIDHEGVVLDDFLELSVDLAFHVETLRGIDLFENYEEPLYAMEEEGLGAALGWNCWEFARGSLLAKVLDRVNRQQKKRQRQQKAALRKCVKDDLVESHELGLMRVIDMSVLVEKWAMPVLHWGPNVVSRRRKGRARRTTSLGNSPNLYDG